MYRFGRIHCLTCDSASNCDRRMGVDLLDNEEERGSKVKDKHNTTEVRTA